MRTPSTTGPHDIRPHDIRPHKTKRRIRSAMCLTAAAAITAIAIPVASATAGTADTAGARHDPAAVVAALDTQYQAAVKANDAATMDRLLAEDFVLVTGRGTAFTRAELVGPARTRDCTYEHQEEVAGTQTVRVFGNQTAVVTAQLWEKGTCTDGTSFDSHLWFSDTYVRHQDDWIYVFGQASRPL
jgi:ketosteroid isomerase-like protein